MKLKVDKARSATFGSTSGSWESEDGRWSFRRNPRGQRGCKWFIIPVASLGGGLITSDDIALAKLGLDGAFPCRRDAIEALEEAISGGL